MKKTTTSIFLMFLVLSEIHSQAIDFISINNIKARINVNGILFTDLANNVPDFEVPKLSNSYALYAASLCISAEDSLGNSIASGAAYQSDFTPGPLTVGTATTTTQIEAQFNKIWQVGSFQINNHKNQYNSPSYITPTNIQTWPAHGDTSLGYSYNLAPFVDVNTNGVYEPDSGDYPDIKGVSAYYFIYNDSKNHAQTGGNPMGLEIHCMVYAFPTNNALNQTIFVDYKLINRSNKSYNNCRIGKFVDFNLGNPSDDYIETDVNRSMVFVKNGDNFDENRFGNTGYGSLHAALGVLTLQGPLLDQDSLDNNCGSSNTNYQPNGLGFADGIIDNERFGLSNCISINDHSQNISGGDFRHDTVLYKFMQSTWKDGRPQTYGGTAYLTSGGINSRIPYFSSTDSSNYSTSGVSVANNWTEDNIVNVPGDRKVIISSGSFTLNSSDEQQMTYAYLFSRATTASSVQSSVTNLKTDADTVINYFRKTYNKSQCSILVGIKENNFNGSSNIEIYPNPSIGNVIINLTEPLNLKVLSINGTVLSEQRLGVGKNVFSFSDNVRSGVYIFQFTDTYGMIQMKKVIKN